jgi:hypothetical protein
MEHLSEAMRAAVADPPPSGIDLDRLIGGERRARQRRWFAGGAAALVVLSAAGAVTATVRVPGGSDVGGMPSAAGGPEPLGACTAVRPAPTASSTGAGGKATGPGPGALPAAPTEPRTAAVPRLSTALNAAVASALPAMAYADDVHPNCEAIQFEPDLYPAMYYASLEARDAKGVGIVVVMIHYIPFVAMESYTHRETRPDGTQVGWSDDAPMDPRIVQAVQVSVARPDGTFLTLLSQNITGANFDVATRERAPATAEQLIAIGTDPGLTLYP